MCAAGKHSVYNTKTNLRDCQPCPVDTIQWHSNQTTCITCPALGVVCKDRAYLNVSSGYFIDNRSWALVAQPTPVRCPYLGTCKGGVSPEELCTIGSTGPLCGTCEIGYYLTDGTCRTCGGSITSTVILVDVGIFILLVAILAYLLGTVDQWRYASRLPACLPQGLRRVLIRRVPTIIKIIMNYCQMVYVFDVLDNMGSVRWPRAFIEFINHLNIALLVGIQAWLSRLLLPLSCTVGEMSAYTWLFITLATPVACSLIILALACIAHCMPRKVTIDGKELEIDKGSKGLVAAIYTLHIWLILFFYPSLCRAIFSVFSCVKLGEEYLLKSDTRLQCYIPEQYPWIALSIAGMVVYAIGAPLIFFVFTWRWQYEPNPERRQQLGLRLDLLVKSYTDDCWWFEAADLVRKLLLTSIVLQVAPGTRVQLWFGLLISMTATIANIAIKPYRDYICQGLQTAAMLQVTFDYMTANVYFYEPGQATNPKTASFLGPPLILVNCVAFVGLLIVLLRGTQKALNVKPARLGDGSPALAGRPLGQFHCFVSHAWNSGQDQARTIKSQLTALVTDLRVFLDVDDLNEVDALEKLIDATDTVIIFLSGLTLKNGAACSDYMTSRNCLRELRAAVEKKKPIIFVIETDKQHGGVPLDVHRRDCPPDLVQALDEHPILPWHRAKIYLAVSMRLIVESLLQTEVKIPGELMRSEMRMPFGAACVLYVSPHNPGASEVADLLAAEAQHVGFPLTISTDPDAALTAGVALVYLNDRTHDRAEALHAELVNVLDAKRPMLLVQEFREAHGALSFGDIIQRTPQHLKERGLYTQLASPLYDGEHHQLACLLAMLRILMGDAPDTRSSFFARFLAQFEYVEHTLYDGLFHLARRWQSRKRPRPSLAAFDGASAPAYPELTVEMVEPPNSRGRSTSQIARVLAMNHRSDV